MNTSICDCFDKRLIAMLSSCEFNNIVVISINFLRDPNVNTDSNVIKKILNTYKNFLIPLVIKVNYTSSRVHQCSTMFQILLVPCRFKGSTVYATTLRLYFTTTLRLYFTTLSLIVCSPGHKIKIHL